MRPTFDGINILSNTFLFGNHTEMEIQTWTSPEKDRDLGLRPGTVLSAKSDSDFMFVYKVIRDLLSIYHLCINPIHRIGLIHK